ncbi:MAG: T9SS type A sorting domain-containing protein, partial [Bacteroidales bacterium]|nr:T9SS type A sorting domain-containing protein [Bacteroidales bacterium]
DDYSIVRTYDAVANLTTYSPVTNEAFIISNADRQVLIAGNDGTPINLLQTTRVLNAQSLTWKYRLQGEAAYQEFSPAETGVSLTPNFASSGTYFVRAEGVDAEGVDIQSGDVEIYVGTDKIDITPYFESQYSRVNAVLYTLDATVEGTYTGFEWKYATTPGGPYLSFDPLANELSHDPVFGAEGNYYVVAEATIDGNFHRSAEMLYIVEGLSASRNIKWTGAFSTDAHYAANYSPVAPFFKGHVSYEAGTEREAIISGVENDTIASLYLGNANLIINRAEESVFNVRGSGTYLEGKLMIQSGIVDFSAEYVHIPDNADTVIVSGNSVMKTRNLLMGNKALSTGGALFIEDNASVYIRYLDRVSTAKDSVSRVWLSDKGVLYMEGNQMNRGGDLIETGKINCPEEFFEPYMVYDKSIDYTFFRAIDTRAFALADDAKQYTGAGEVIATPLTLINGDGLTTFSWYWSSNPTGPWTMFDGSTDTPSFAPSFEESGTYFVVAIGSDGTEEVETVNVATIEVVGLSISPDELEMLPGQGSEMNYILTEGIKQTSRAWWNLTDEENPVVLSNDSTFIPSFTELGTYIIGFQAEVQDEYNNNYFLSATATVKVVDELTSIGDVQKARVSVYPNPSTGAFSVDAEGSYSVEVYDLTGKLVLRQDASQGQQPITLAQKGVFLVKVLAGKDVQVTRVVIK